MNKVRGYVFSRPFMGERVPQHIQNQVIRDYCKKNNYLYMLSSTEYSMNECFYMLEKSISELNEVNGLVAYSINQLPIDSLYRKKILKRIILKKKSIHFALESFMIKNSNDIVKLEELIYIIKIIPMCLKEINYGFRN